MGLLTWLMSLGEPQQRSKDKSRARKEARKERDWTTRSRRPRPVSTQPSSSPEPTGHVPTEIITDEATHIRIPDEIKGDVVEGNINYTMVHRTAAENDAIRQAALRRSAMAAQQQALSQQQMNALWSMQQDAALLMGSSDPLMGTPYWQRMYGELGRGLGPFYPHDHVPRPKGGK